MRNYKRLNLPCSGMISSVGRRGNSSQQPEPILTVSPMHVSSYGLKRQSKYFIKILNNNKDPISSMVSRMHPEDDLSNRSLVHIKNCPLSSITNLNLNNALFVINKVLQECMNFHHHHGYSNFDLNYCNVSKQGDLTIKIIDLGHKETDQTITVQKILKQIQTLCSPKIMNDFISYFNRNKLKTICNYKCTKSLIKAYCICSKIQLTNKLNLQPKVYPNTYKSVDRNTQIQSSQGKVKKIRNMDHLNYGHQNQQQVVTSQASYKFLSFKDKTVQNNPKDQQLNHIFNAKLCKSSLLQPHNSLKIPSVLLSKGKGSQTSTNLQTSENHSSSKENYSDFDYPEEIPSLPGIKHTSSSQFYPSAIHRPLLQTSLSQVQSHYESCSDHNLSPDGKNQLQDQMPHDWVQKIDIFAFSKETIESFSEGKDEVMEKTGSNPQNLGKMARVICQSCLLAPPEKKE